MPDIFDLRDHSLSKRVIAPDPEWVGQINAEPTAAELAKDFDHLNREGQWPTPEQRGSLRCACGNLLTIEDRYSRCRECMLSL